MTNEHEHSHQHTHADGTTHSHPHSHEDEHRHEHAGDAAQGTGSRRDAAGAELPPAPTQQGDGQEAGTARPDTPRTADR